MVSNSPAAMVTSAGAGLTCFPLTVMSILLVAGAEDVGLVTDDDDVADVADVGGVEGADVGADEARPVWEQDASTSVAVRQNAGVRHLRSRDNLAMRGSLGRFV